MNGNNRLHIRYEVSTYRGPGTEPEVHSITAAELAAIDLTSFDHVLWPSRNLLAFRDAAGEWVEKPLQGSGMGDVCLRILDVLQQNVGTFVECGEIAELTDNENLYDTNALAVRVKAIRKTHGDCPRTPRFLVTRRRGGYALMWPAERTWITIVRITPHAPTEAA